MIFNAEFGVGNVSAVSKYSYTFIFFLEKFLCCTRKDEHKHQEKSPRLMGNPDGKPAFIACNVPLGKILFITSFNL